MTEPFADTLTPVEEERKHEQAILATLPAPKFKNIPSREMHIFDFMEDFEHHSESRVQLYRETWAPALVHVPIVHQEGPSRYGIIDGRHRWLASKHKPQLFHCAVHSGLVDEQKIALFLFHNQHRRNPSAKEKFMAAVATGSPIAVAVQRVAQTRGASGELKAYAAAQRVILDGSTIPLGVEALDFALRTLMAAYGADDKRRLDSMLVRASGRFFHKHGTNPALEEAKFVATLNLKGKRVAAQLKMIGTGASGTSGPGGANAVFRQLEDEYSRFFRGGHRL